MSSVQGIRTGDTKTIVLSLFVSALGFYLAIALSEAINGTIGRVFPDDDEFKRLWISVIVAIVIVVISVYIIVTFVNK